MHRSLFLILLAILITGGCGGPPQSDAFGNFEATEITVSAQADGQIMAFRLNEGDLVGTDQIIAIIDSTQLVIQRDALRAQVRQLEAQQIAMGAQERAARLQVDEARAQVDALGAQRATAATERDRTERMLASGAATDRELNDLEGRVATLSAQVRQAETRVSSAGAQVAALGAQQTALAAQLDAARLQEWGVMDRLSKTLVRSPADGTVLTVLAQAGELVRTGSPLATVADLDPLVLRVYVTGDQLPSIRIGMEVEVRVDDGQGGLDSRPGTVSFIASESEFTPSTIQTRDARADLVYAVKVRTANEDGMLKRGMPGEVRFAPAGDTE